MSKIIETDLKTFCKASTTDKESAGIEVEDSVSAKAVTADFTLSFPEHEAVSPSIVKQRIALIKSLNLLCINFLQKLFVSVLNINNFKRKVLHFY